MTPNDLNCQVRSLDALHDYVHRYGDSEIINACDKFYEVFIQWEIRRNNSIQIAESLGNQLVKKYLLNEEVA